MVAHAHITHASHHWPPLLLALIDKSRSGCHRSDPASYYEYLDKTLPIGPNVATFIGYCTTQSSLCAGPIGVGCSSVQLLHANPSLCKRRHSDLRVAAMGLDRAATTHKPEAGELKIMAELLDLALDAG